MPEPSQSASFFPRGAIVFFVGTIMGAAVASPLVAYAPPLNEVISGPTQAVPGYDPASPIVAGP